MAAPVGSAAPGVAIGGKIKAAWQGAPNNGPTYILQRENINDIASFGVCIVTDGAMQIDKQASGRNTNLWHKRATSAGGLNPMALFNTANWIPAMGVPGTARETIGDSAGNHTVKIMINVANFNATALAGGVGSFQHLRVCVLNALNRYIHLPAASPGYPHNWRWRGASIAFDLIGSGQLGYGSERAAENVLAAIQGWFNDPTAGGARRAAITTVYLLSPDKDSLDPTMCEAAWRRAWYRYVNPRTRFDPPGSQLAAIARMKEESDDIQDRNPGLIDGTPGLRGKLIQGPGVVGGAVGIVLP